MFFKTLPWQHLLSFVRLHLTKKMIWGPSGSQNSPFWRPLRHKGCKKEKSPQRAGPSLARPCFSLNHSSYCAVGTYWFSKRHLVDELLLFFRICLCSACDICFYHLFIICSIQCHDTSSRWGLRFS